MSKKVIFNKDFTVATVSKEFKEKMYQFGTEEFDLFHKIRAIYPHITFRVGSTYVQKTKKITYERMRDYLSDCDNADQRLAEMDRIQKQSKIQRNPYRYVLEWFMTVCPELFTEDEAKAA